MYDVETRQSLTNEWARRSRRPLCKWEREGGKRAETIPSSSQHVVTGAGKPSTTIHRAMADHYAVVEPVAAVALSLFKGLV